jgi:hypothetical protein
MGSEPPNPSYLDALFAAIRDAGERLVSAEHWLKSAERAAPPSWRMQFIAAAHRAQAEARAKLDDAENRLQHLGAVDHLPAPLDQLPRRLLAMRSDLRASEHRLSRVVLEAASRSFGDA